MLNKSAFFSMLLLLLVFFVTSGWNPPSVDRFDDSLSKLGLHQQIVNQLSGFVVECPPRDRKVSNSKSSWIVQKHKNMWFQTKKRMNKIKHLEVGLEISRLQLQMLWSRSWLPFFFQLSLNWFFYDSRGLTKILITVHSPPNNLSVLLISHILIFTLPQG